MTKVVEEIRYDEDGRKVKRAETVADKCGSGYVGQQQQRKWSDRNSKRGVIEIGRRGDESVGKINLSLLVE